MGRGFARAALARVPLLAVSIGLAGLAGCGLRVEVAVDSPFKDEPSHGPAAPFDRFLVPSYPLPVPSAPPLTVPEPPTVAGWPVGPDGTVVRIDVHADPEQSGMFSFGADGRVVRVADTSITMDRGDLTTWRLTREQLATTLGVLDALGVRSATPGDFGESAGPSASVLFEPGRVLSGTDERWMSTMYAVTEPPRRGVRPWVPDRIGFLAGPPDRTGRSPLTGADPFRRWPLRRGIRELSLSTAPNAYGEQRRVVCLGGRPAAKVWRRLFTGENTAYLRVDDGRRWELQAFVSLPGYQPQSAPCAGAG